MSPIALGLDLFLAALLIAALGFGWRLERRLKALRDGQGAFAASVRDLDEAARRADAGLRALRDALGETHDDLHDRIQKGRALKAELETLIRRAETLPRATPVPVAPLTLTSPEPARPAARPPAAAANADAPLRLPRLRARADAR